MVLPLPKTLNRTLTQQNQKSPPGHIFLLTRFRTSLIISRWLVVQAILNYPSAALSIPMADAFLPTSPPITNGTKNLVPPPLTPPGLSRNLPKQVLSRVKQLGAKFYMPTDIGAPLFIVIYPFLLLPQEILLPTCTTLACLI